MFLLDTVISSLESRKSRNNDIETKFHFAHTRFSYCVSSVLCIETGRALSAQISTMKNFIFLYYGLAVIIIFMMNFGCAIIIPSVGVQVCDADTPEGADKYD